MSKHETETTYDDLMFPLVEELIRIALENNIPLFLTAAMLDEEGEPMHCTTIIPSDRPELAGSQNRYSLCRGVVMGHSGFDTAAGMVITRHHPPVEETN